MKIWISTLIPLVGADTYGGVRVQASLSEEDCWRDLAEWLEIEYESPAQVEDALDDEGGANPRDGYAVSHWSVEEQTVENRSDSDSPGRCVTCWTQCRFDADGSSVICPNCDWKDRAIALLRALGDLGTQDLYTDADEYQNRVGAMQDLCGMAGAMAAEASGMLKAKFVTLPEIEETANVTEEVED